LARDEPQGRLADQILVLDGQRGSVDGQQMQRAGEVAAALRVSLTGTERVDDLLGGVDFVE